MIDKEFVGAVILMIMACLIAVGFGLAFGDPETEWVKVGSVRCLMVDSLDRFYDANGDCWITKQSYEELQYQ